MKYLELNGFIISVKKKKIYKFCNFKWWVLSMVHLLTIYKNLFYLFTVVNFEILNSNLASALVSRLAALIADIALERASTARSRFANRRYHLLIIDSLIIDQLIFGSFQSTSAYRTSVLVCFLRKSWCRLENSSYSIYNEHALCRLQNRYKTKNTW